MERIDGRIIHDVYLDRVVFRETFTGDGAETEFTLSGPDAAQVTFKYGAWAVANVKTTLPSHATKTDKKPAYDSLIPLTRNRISVSAINAVGVVTLSHAPRAIDFYIWYWYDLPNHHLLENYYREDFVASMEEEATAYGVDISVDTTNFAGIFTGADSTVQKALDTADDHTHSFTEVNTALAAANAAIDLNSQNLTNVASISGITGAITAPTNLANKTTSAWSKTIGATGDYADWATMIAAMPDMLAHAVTVTIQAGTTLTEECAIKNKHALTVDGTITIQAEKYFPTSGGIPIADSATTTTLRDAALATAALGNDYFNGCWIFIVHGTGTDNGYVAITDYVDATGDVVVAAWPGTQPDSTSQYLIVGALIDAGAEIKGLDIRYVSAQITALGIGVKDSLQYGINVEYSTKAWLGYCGVYNSASSGAIFAYGLNTLAFCGIVKNNTDDNTTHGGVHAFGGGTAYIDRCGISDNNQQGLYSGANGFIHSRTNFGDSNGTWGTYITHSGNAKFYSDECSGSSGNHTKEYTAGAADYDSFLVNDSGVTKTRTGAQVLSDIGACANTFTAVNALLAAANAAIDLNSQNLTSVGTIGCGNVTGGTYNALTLAAAATGFTIAGGSTSKTLTVDNNFVVSTQLAAIGANTTKVTCNFTNVQTALAAASGAVNLYNPAADNGGILQIGKDDTSQANEAKLILDKSGAGVGSIVFSRANGASIDWTISDTADEELVIEAIRDDEDFTIKINDGGVTKIALHISGSNNGIVTLPSLAGVGTRAVVVDENGVLSAP